MGKYILGILLFFISASAVAQFIPQSIGGAPNSLSSVQGAITGKKGVVIQAFPDTLTVNADPSIKKTNGLIIKVGDTLYFRNQAISKWISLGVNNSVNVVYHGVDSVTTPSLGQICVWTGGLPNCFTVTTPVVPSGNVDSVTVINNQLCYYTAGVPTCYTVSSSIVNNTYITQLIDSSIAINNYYNGIDPCLPTILEGSIIWVNGFNFSNTKYKYRIGCQLDSAEAGDFSITESNDSIPFYVSVYADTLGNIGTKNGDYSGGSAQIPNLDPLSQILLATYLVPANSTQPQSQGGGTIANDTVYISNAEWVGTSTIAGANFAYNVNPFSPLLSTRIPSFTNIANQYLEYTDGTSHSVSEYTYLSFYLRLGATFAANTRLNISFYNAGNPITQAAVSLSSGTFGYTRTIVGAYQLIVIPIESWAFTSGTFNKVRITTSGSNASGFQLDNVILQRGGNNTSTNGVITFNNQAGNVTSTTVINADSSYEVHIVNGVRTDSTKILKTVGIGEFGIIITTTAARDTARFNIDSSLIATRDRLANALALKENALGNPSIDGQFLSSTISGVRSWVTLSGGGGGGVDTTFNSIAILRDYDATSVTNGTYIQLSGYYTPNDGGGGMFVWNSTSTTTDNGGTIIKSTPVTTGRWVRVYNGNPDAFMFGAIPNGSRIVTENLQALLDLTGHVVIPYSPLKFIIDDRLIIKSDTWLEVDPLDTIYEASGNNVVLIRNENIDTVGITDHDITITGGIWDGNWVGNPGTTLFSSYSQLQSDKIAPVRAAAGNLGFFGVRNLVVKDLTVINAVTFSIQVSMANNIEVGNVNFIRNQATVSDGIHLNGPLTNFYVHDLTGRTGDDLIALNAWDWLVSSPIAGGVGGNIRKGIIERILPDTSTWGAIKMYTGTNAGVYDVAINDVKAVSINAVFGWVSGSLEPDQHTPSHTTGMGKIGNINVNGVSGKTLQTGGGGVGYGSIVTIACDAENITINNAYIDTFYKPFLNQPWLRQESGTLIKNLAINNFIQNDSLAWNNLFDLRGTVNDFSLTNSSFYGSSSIVGNRGYGAVVLNATSSVRNVTVVNSKFKGVMGAVFKDGYASDTSNVIITGCTFDSCAYPVIAGALMKLQLSGNSFRKNNNYILQTHQNTTVVSSGNYSDGNGGIIDKAGGTVRWNGIDLGVDASLLTPVAYDNVKNTNSGSASLGLNQWSGSTWIPFGGGGSLTGSGVAARMAYWSSTSALTSSANMTFDGTTLNMAGSTTANTAQFGTFGIQSYATNNGWLSDNAYFDGANFRYRANGTASLIYFASGGVIIQRAASGSAGGTITFLTSQRWYSDGKIEAAVYTDYADNAAALAGGLTAGMFYRTGDIVKQVH